MRKRFNFLENQKLIFLFLFWLFLTNTHVVGADTVLETNQQQVVSGTVVDQAGEAVIGASIIYKGTSLGVVTDYDGNFSLQVPSMTGTIVISYVGYQTEEITINNRSSIQVILKEDTELLDEVVVIGYGTVKKRDLTGAVSSVKTSDIVQSPTSNAMDAIQGRIAGMDITRSGGGAGSGVNIIIRGTKTLGYTDIYGNKTRNTDPLFIIDGVQGGSYADLNPNDIESIDVLKDASSTAIYGSLGSNGVVIITTKKGSNNKINISYDGFYGANGFVDYPSARTGESYMNVRREAYKTVGQWASTADDYKIFSNEEWDAIQKNQWVNWIDELVRQGSQQSHNVTLSSNTDKLNTYVSVGYYNERHYPIKCVSTNHRV